MEGDVLAAAVGGATAMGCSVVGLMFLRHWTRTRDRLLMFFAASFFAMAVNRVALIVGGEAHEGQTWVYLVRLAAFVLILLGILEKNMGRRIVPLPETLGEHPARGAFMTSGHRGEGVVRRR